MSVVLDKILQIAADEAATTVTLSGESVTVLLYALGFIESRKSWLDLKEDPLDEITAAEWDTIEEIVANLAQEVMTEVIPVEQIFPIYAAFSAAEMKSIVGAGTKTLQSAAVPFGTYMAETSPAIGDVWQYDILLDAGTYNMAVWWRRDTDCGNFEFKIDGITTNSGDLYGAGSIQNQSWNVDISPSGLHTVSTLCVGKNAASSSYRSRLAAIIFTKV
jgi:hypothetical protein